MFGFIRKAANMRPETAPKKNMVAPTKPDWYNHEWEIYHRGSVIYPYGIKKDGEPYKEFHYLMGDRIAVLSDTIDEAKQKMYRIIQEDIDYHKSRSRAGETIVRWP